MKRMVGTPNGAVHKIPAIEMNLDWDMCFVHTLGSYRRPSGSDEKFPFEILFGI